MRFGRWWLCLPLLLTGCVHSPSINVLGAFFPDWMFCIVGGLILAGILNQILKRTGVAKVLGAATLGLLFPVASALFALLGWIAFFQN